MVRPVAEGITVTIKGRLFELVWDDDDIDYPSCFVCALRNEVCKTNHDINLTALCIIIVQEPNTYFIEKPVKA